MDQPHPPAGAELVEKRFEFGLARHDTVVESKLHLADGGFIALTEELVQAVVRLLLGAPELALDAALEIDERRRSVSGRRLLIRASSSSDVPAGLCAADVVV